MGQNNIFEAFGQLFVGIIGIVLAATLSFLPLWWAWNVAVVPLFGAPFIEMHEWYEAYGLSLILARLHAK